MFDMLYDGTPWEDTIPGPEGPDGWWKDVGDTRLIFFFGTWWQRTEGAPEHGYGDIVADLDFFPTRCRGGFAHKGFLQEAHEALHYLFASGIIRPGMRLAVAGHSLGAAVAAHVAMELLDAGMEVKEVTLYGCPTTWGSRKLVRAFREAFPRAVNHVVGLDWTRWLWLAVPVLGCPAPTIVHPSPRNWWASLRNDHNAVTAGPLVPPPLV